MRGFMLIVTAIAAFIVVGPASATPTAGVHGAAIRDFSVFGFQGKYTVAVDATRTPSGEIAGHINFFVRDTPLIKFGWFQAEPTHVEINGNTGSVVGEITKLTGWYDTPIITVFKVVDVVGGPDIFGLTNFYSPIDPMYACSLVETTMAFTAGNFTVLP